MHVLVRRGEQVVILRLHVVPERLVHEGFAEGGARAERERDDARVGDGDLVWHYAHGGAVFFVEGEGVPVTGGGEHVGDVGDGVEEGAGDVPVGVEIEGVEDPEELVSG